MDTVVKKETRSSFPLAVYILMVSAFAIGTTEFVIMGLLPDVAHDLDVSISKAGLLISGYALGVAIGGPILTIFTVQLPRKTLLLILMTLFIMANMLSALASSYSILMIGRILSSLTHGTLFGIGSVVAARLVSPDRQASAIAMMFVGVTLANVLGVPLGTFIGQHFHWRTTFWVVSALGLIAWIATLLFIPKLSNVEQPSFRQEFMVFLRPQVWLTLLMTIVGFCGLFILYTFIAPLATRTAHFSSEAITYLTLLFGVGITVGNIVGGKWADRRLMPTLIGMLILLTITLASFSFLSQYKTATIILIFLLGFAAFGTVPAFQIRILEKAKGAPNLASSLNIGAFNLGNAGGAWIGGFVIDHAWGYQSLGWVAAVITVVGLAITLLGQALDRQQS